MKRDMDLVRAILFAVESAGEGQILSNSGLQVDGFTAGQISAHVQLLEEAGFLRASISQEIGHVTARGFHIYGLTWSGHEFLDTVRDASVWEKTKSTIVSRGGSLSFEVVKALAMGFLKQQLGLSP